MFEWVSNIIFLIFQGQRMKSASLFLLPHVFFIIVLSSFRPTDFCGVRIKGKKNDNPPPPLPSPTR